MFRITSLTVATVLFAGLPHLKADPPASKPPDSKPTQTGLRSGVPMDDTTSLFRAVRIVRDLAEFNFGT